MKKSIGPKSIIYPTPVFIVGTYDKEGRPNIMAAAWGGICCSSPPCISVSLRKATYTYGNLMEQKAFTVSIPSSNYVREADYAGIYSRHDEDKFISTGLTPVKSDLVNAPYVKEFPFILECRVIHVIEIGLHTQFIGEVLDIKVDEDCIGEKGLLDIDKIKPFLFAPDRKRYYAIGECLGKAFSMGRKDGNQ